MANLVKVAKRNGQKVSGPIHPLRNIAVIAGDLETHIDEALTVIGVAEQAYGGDDLSGVFALIECKLLAMRTAQEQIAALTSCSAVVQRTEGRPS